MVMQWQGAVGCAVVGCHEVLGSDVLSRDMYMSPTCQLCTVGSHLSVAIGVLYCL